MQAMTAAGYRPTVYSWSSLMDALGKGGKYAQVASTFERMQAEGCRPNLITFAALLASCARCSRWEDALCVLYALQRSGGEHAVTMCRLVMAGAEEEEEERFGFREGRGSEGRVEAGGLLLLSDDEGGGEGVVERTGDRAVSVEGDRGVQRNARKGGEGRQEALWNASARMLRECQVRTSTASWCAADD